MQVIWQPTVDSLAKQADLYGDICMLISPYCKAHKLEQLLDTISHKSELPVIVRFTAQEIANGSTDIEVYKTLINRGHKLYSHPNIHLKLYLMGQNRAFLSSANLTERGLGETANRNVEVGTMVQLTVYDWLQVRKIISESQLVTEETYNLLESARDNKADIQAILDNLHQNNGYYFDDLPALENVDDFIKVFKSMNLSSNLADFPPEYISDYLSLGAENFSSSSALLDQISESFLEQKYIQNLLQLLQERTTLNFGSVTAWYHENMLDRPMPYRADIKKRINNLYNWLSELHPNVSWDIPGARSQILRWK